MELGERAWSVAPELREPAWGERLFGVKPGEGSRTALLFAYLFCGSAVFILGRTVRDTLFLSRYPLSALPWMFVLFGVVSALIAIAYAVASERFRRSLQMQGVLALGAGSYIGVWFLVRAGVSWIYPVFYIWTEVIANLLIMQFWTLANDLHDPRSAKRLFGLIGSARILGVIVCGLSAGIAVRALGTPQLLWVMTGLLALMAVLAGTLSRYSSKAPLSPSRRAKPEPLRGLLGQPYVRVLAAMILLIFVALTLGDYQFKMIARQNFTEDALARFFSLFYAGAGTVGLLIQLFATPRILKGLGVLWAMAVLPLCFAGSAGLLLATGSLAAVCMMKFSDNGLQFTIHETVMQVLYVPFAPAVKARTRALLDTAVKPLSYGLGGAALLLLTRLEMPVVKMAWVSLPIVLLWIALLPKVRQLYLRSLEASIAGLAGAFETDSDFVLDSESRKVLVHALTSPDPSQILHALERLAGEDGPEIRAGERALLGHPSPKIREHALQRIAERNDEMALPAVKRGLSDLDPAVQAAAVRAACALGREEALEAVAPLLDSEVVSVRVASAAGLISFGGIEGAVLGGGRLQSLMESEATASRVEAAEILRRVGPPGYRPLKRLLADTEPSVRGAALRAAATTADPRLVPLLVEALATEKGRKRAARALAAVGPAAVDPLIALVKMATAPREVKLAVPRILRMIRDKSAYDGLLLLPPPADPQVRLRVWAALGQLREELGRPPLPLEVVQARVEEELLGTLAWAVSWKVARPIYGTPLLEDFFAQRFRRTGRRVLRILEQRYPRKEVALVLRRLSQPKGRATALEVLDTVLEVPLKRRVMPLFESEEAGELLPLFQAKVPPAMAPASFLQRLCEDPNPYGAFCAFHAAVEHAEKVVLDEAAHRLDDPDAIAREGALLALGHLGGPAWQGRIAEKKKDADPVVASLARAWSSEREPVMYSTAEKILFLMSVPIFEKLPGEDLVPLARAAEVVSLKPGEVLFEEGEMGDALFVVMRGWVKIARAEVVLAQLGVKEAFGEMALIEASPRSARAIAECETEVLRIESDDFYEVLHEQVEIAEGILKVLVRRLREADEKLQRSHGGGGGTPLEGK